MSKRDVQTTLIFDTSKTYQKRYKKDHDFLSFKNIKTSTTCFNFSSIEIALKKYIETMSIFRPSKLGWEMYVETTSKFHPSNLRWTKYVEMTSKKIRGNEVDFSFIEI